MYNNFVNHESETKKKIHQWVRSKVDYSQENKKRPYTFHGDISFHDSLLPDTSQLKHPVVACFRNNVLDHDTRADLENVGVLNWCRSVFKLFAVNVPRDGSCLLHSAFIAIWGVTDSKTTLRELLLLTISNDYNKKFKSRWQCQRTCDLPSIGDHSPEIIEKEWDDVIRSVSDLSKGSVSSAAVPHRFLESIHVFVLANILRRPIIVLADSSVRSPHGTALQENHMSGIYLPLEWNSSDCCKTPIILGYSQNHFCPLISESSGGKKAKKGPKVFPLVSQDLEPLRVRFLTHQEENQVWELLQEYLSVQEIEVEGKDHTKVTVLCAELQFQSLPSDQNTFQEYLQLCEKTYSEAYGAGVSLKESQKQRPMTTNKAAEMNETVGNPYHSIQLSSQTEVVNAVRSPAGKTSQKKSGGKTNTEMAQRGRAETGRAKGNNLKKCSTPDCNKLADPNENNLCDDCIRKLSVMEAGAELVSVQEGSAHYYELRRGQSTGLGNQVQNTEEGNFAMGNEQFRSPVDLEMVATAPPLSYQGPPSVNQLSSMMEERCHKCRAYRCSTQTHPLCHECFGAEQEMKRQDELQNIMPTAPADSVSFLNVEGNKGNVHTFVEGMKGLSVSQGVSSHDWRSHDMSSYENITGQSENEKKTRDTKSAEEKIRNDIGTSSTSRFQQPTSTGLANGLATAPVASFTSAGRADVTGGQAFAETEIKASSDVEVSEEPVMEMKCPGPTCINYILPSEKLCRKCKDILLRYGQQESGGTNHAEASSRSNHGGREIELQREKERQFSSVEFSRPPLDVSTLSSTRSRPHARGKHCTTPNCPNYGDPSMDGKCSQCFLKKSAPFVKAYTAPVITTRQTRSERTSNASVTQSPRYVPSQSFRAAGGPPTSNYYPSTLHHIENIPSQPISMASDEDEFSSIAPSSSMFRPVPTSSGMAVNYDSMMVTSKTSWSTNFEKGQESSVTASKPPSGVAATKLLSGVTTTKPLSGVAATTDADREFNRTHENLEETFKRMAKKCNMGNCQNYGNQRKKGYCNSCYEIYRQQFEAMQIAQYGEDVPDNIVYDSTMSL